MGFLDDVKKGKAKADAARKLAEARKAERVKAVEEQVANLVKPTDPPADLSTGWKPDPSDPHRLWFWTGSRWLNKTVEAKAPEAPQVVGTTVDGQPVVVVQQPPPKQDNDTLRVFGWLGAIFLWPLGLVLGIILMTRNDSQGPWITVVSLVWPIIFVLLIGTAGILSA